MRRWLGVIVASALVTMLWPRIAFAAFEPTLSNSSPEDFRAQIFRSAFSEASDGEAAFTPDARGGESFFREYAFHVSTVPAGTGTAQIKIPHTALPRLSINLFQTVSTGSVTPVSAADFKAPTIATPNSAGDPPLSSVAAPVIGLYQQAAPTPTSGPASFRFDLTNSRDNASRLVTFSPTLNPQEGFSADAGAPNAATALPQAQAAVAVPVRVGHLRVQPHVEGAQADVPSLALHDNAVNTGATFNTRVGPQKFDIDVSSGFEHLTVNQPTVNSSSFDSTANMQMSDGNLPVLVPAYADVSKRTVAAGVGVPVTRNVTLNVQAETQHLMGGYGAPGLGSNLDAQNTVYGGKVTFQLPHAPASVSLSAKQYRYQDNLTPTTFTQTSANVNFTVKF